MTNRPLCRIVALNLLVIGVWQASGPVNPSPAILWREPSDLERRDLLYGSGGKNNAPPSGPFQFVKEDRKGTSPKFTARDSNGVKWKVKLGPEARPETVATRFVWAAGYFTDEDYLIEQTQILDVPVASLSKRLKVLNSPQCLIRNARFEREGKRDKANEDNEWSWKSGGLVGSRELNGLRTLMAVINNWDLKDENNAVRTLHSGEPVYAVSDLGAAFGPTHFAGHEKSRGNLKAYEHSKFLARKTAERVSFATPGRPAWFVWVNPGHYWMRVKLESIGRDVPRADAKWIGTILARLSSRQIRDAFRAGGYSQGDVESFARVVENRIAELNAL